MRRCWRTFKVLASIVTLFITGIAFTVFSVVTVVTVFFTIIGGVVMLFIKDPPKDKGD